MAHARRATIAADITKRINDWLVDAHEYMRKDSFEFKSLFKDAEKLAKADGYAGTVARAMVEQLAGDIDEALRWVSNARSWPAHAVSTAEVQTLAYSNLGFFTEAAKALEEFEPVQEAHFEPLISLSLLTCSFKELLSRLEGAEVAKAECGRSAIRTCQRCLMTLENVNANEADMRAVLDIAGEVLRVHKVFFAGSDPVIRTCEDGLLYQLQVRTDVGTASSMTDEVIDQMIERDLDVRGLSFSFVPA